MAESAVVGQWTAAPGAEEIVTGKARYCPDIQLPGLLCGKALVQPACTSANQKARCQQGKRNALASTP